VGYLRRYRVETMLVMDSRVARVPLGVGRR
jgi:hypothetical protein